MGVRCYGQRALREVPENDRLSEASLREGFR
jgi:hypothetical protein